MGDAVMVNVSSFTLRAELPLNRSDSACDCADSLTKVCSSETSPSDLILVAVETVKICLGRQLVLRDDNPEFLQVAIFIPGDLVDLSSDEGFSQTEGTELCDVVVNYETSKRNEFEKKLLSMIHPALDGARVRGIIRPHNAGQAPANILLLDAKSPGWIASVLNDIDGEGLLARHDAIIKALPLSEVVFVSDASESHVASLTMPIEIPSCPVCIHRIDPLKLGLPKPKNHNLCSKFCGVAGLGASSNEGCRKQRFLAPWPAPSDCAACHVIQQHQKNASKHAARQLGLQSYHSVSTEQLQSSIHDDSSELFCTQCAMQSTLWVCLLCGFVGCGRYSNVHAAEHYQQTGHTFSLELVTRRIWDYANGNGEFVHRGDLLECPSVQRTNDSTFVGRAGAHVTFRGLDSANSVGNLDEEQVDFRNQNYRMPSLYAAGGDEKSPKKANMIGEEYEALLQSALEDQAQHYEGEITRLRAALTAEQVDENAVTAEEMKEIEALNADVARYRADIETLSGQLLDAQGQEVGYRASSQRLLREQAIAKGLLDKIRAEAARENEEGRMQVEELEQQIADLTANLRMRHQFSQDEELNNAQIFGTTSQSKKKRGKKSRRFWK